MKKLVFIAGALALWFLTVNSHAQDENPQTPDTSPITALGTDYQNSIVLLSNRFRIDYEVDEVTLVFFRKYGSSPVVLVRPNGSKIFQTQANGENVSWFDAETYDMVQIKNPVPGPWQAVGQILPESRVMVLSDVQLHADPLPPIIFSGEILKQTARLTNGGEPIDYGPFRDVVELTIDLASTNNPNYDNFGAQAEEIARFEDNGRSMDERPLDGVFTGQFNLAVAAGEWKPIFRVTTPMFTREQVDPAIQLFPTPITIDVDLNGGGDNYHKLIIDTVRELVDINSLLIDGKIRFPNGDVQNFSLTELSGEAREHMIIAFEEGVFRVKLTAYGKTVNGRDFILDVPEYSFLARTSEPESEEPLLEEEAMEPSDEMMPLEETASIEEVNDPESVTIEPEEEEVNFEIVIWVNAGILIVGLLVILIVVLKRKGLPRLMPSFKLSLPKRTKNDESD